MYVVVAQVFPAIMLFGMSFMLTAASLWLAGHLTPWFLSEAHERPTVRSYFLDPSSDMEMSRSRLVTILIATAIMLFVLLLLAIAVKFGGLSLV